MGPMSAHREEELLVAERAADWLRRLKTADGAERAAFVAWLRESPRHVREILLATTWDKVLDAVDPQRRVDLDALIAHGARDVVRLNRTPPPSSEGNTIHRSVRHRHRAGIVAAAVVLVTLAAWISLNRWSQTYATAIGEQHTIELPDGSMLYLNARSKVRVAFSRAARDVYLLEGEALFKVKHDTVRPFRVRVTDAYIQAVGTQFDVHRLTGQTNVAVIEGKVNILTPAPLAPPARESQPIPHTATLAAGETATITPTGTVTQPAAVNAADATAWRQHRLVFRKQTLADIALEFNRYNREPQIQIQDAALASRQFNGVFDADDPESLIRFLQSSEGIAVHRKDGVIVLRAR
jgi:transmembrane sensor